MKMPFIKRFFNLEAHHTSIKTEFLAAITSFSTIAYAIVLVPCLLKQVGMDFGSTMTAMVLTAAFATLLMGLIANYPIIVAPGMSFAIYFVFTVVLAGEFTWQQGLAVIFCVGATLLLLTALGIRQKIVEAMPAALRLATTAGLGLLLAFVGLRNVGLIVHNPATCVAFGDPKTITILLTLLGLLITTVLLKLRVPGAYFLGIVAAWILGLGFSAVEFKGFVSMPASMKPTYMAFDFSELLTPKMLSLYISLLFISLFEVTGTLIGLAEEGKFLKVTKNGAGYEFPRISRALIPDAAGSMLGSVLGISTSTVYLESAAGIGVGGKTGLTAVFVGFFLLLSLFFSPFASSIPTFATAPVLILIGGGMLKVLGGVKWEDPSEWVPAFMTLILIPMTSSATIGIGAGFVLYPLLKLISGQVRQVGMATWILCLIFTLKFILLPPF